MERSCSVVTALRCNFSHLYNASCGRDGTDLCFWEYVERRPKAKSVNSAQKIEVPLNCSLDKADYYYYYLDSQLQETEEFLVLVFGSWILSL